MSTYESVAEAPGATAEPSMSLLQRVVTIYARPTSAWSGLKERAQWWFPLLIMVVVATCGSLAIHHRALMPMLSEQWEEQVANGQMSAEQVEKMEAFMGGSAGMAITAGQQVIAWPLITFVAAAVVWFGVGFVLGTRFTYRLALEVVSWSWLISLPGYVITLVMAWFHQTLKGIHIGLGAFLPVADTPSKLHLALGVVLDALGPLSIWYLAVGILGATALSGAARKSVAWVLAVLYVVVTLFGAGMAALFTPGT